MSVHPVVELGYASYRGRQLSSNCNGFFSVPYAKSPIGPLRFRKPVPLDYSQQNSEPIDATRHRNFAIQTAESPMPGIVVVGSEDCLTVDICAPPNATAGARLPVLTYIYGGAYRSGATKNQPFDHWVQFRPEFITVSVSYRLFALGFLSHPDLETSGAGDFNVGIHDQIEALRWIQRNIVHFGGDPRQISLRQRVLLNDVVIEMLPHVTICGQSAGAASVEILLTAFDGGNTDLFRAAITQSIYRTPVFLPSQKRALFDQLLQELQCPYDALVEQMNWLREKDAIEITLAADAISIRDGTVLGEWKPVVDGVMLTDFPTSLISKGRFVNVPVLIGTTSDETWWLDDHSPWEVPFGIQFPLLLPSDVRDAAKMYLGLGVGLSRASGDALNRHSILPIVEHFRQSWLYRYNQRAGNDTIVQHSAENWIMFKGVRLGPNASATFEDDFSPEVRTFSEEVISYWISFIMTMDPNAHKLSDSPVWPIYHAAAPSRMVLQAGPPTPVGESGSIIETLSENEQDRYRVWVGLAVRMQN